MAAQCLVTERAYTVSPGVLYDLEVGEQLVPFLGEVLQPRGAGT